MRGLLTLLLILFSTRLFAAPQLAWEARHNFGLPTRTHQVVAMTLDKAGDILIAGNQFTPNGDPDYVVLKYSQTGTQLWAKTYSSGPQAYDQLNGIAVDGNDNVYVTGASRTLKYNSDGVLRWVAPYAGTGLAVDSNGFAYLASYQSGDFLTVKLAPAGTNVWMRRHDRPFGNDIALAVALGPAGEVYVGGTVTWAYDRLGSYVKFALVKYDADGNQLWVSPDFAPPGAWHGSGEVKRIIVLDNSRVCLSGNFSGGTAGSYVTELFDSEAGTNIWYFSGLSSSSDVQGMTSVAIPRAGEVYMTGRVPAPSPIRVLCRTVALDTNGALRWQSDYDTLNYSTHRANDIALDAFGNVFITGQSSTNFWPSTFDFLTIKYDNAGRELWIKRYSGPAFGNHIAMGIAVTPDGSIFVAGQSANTNGGTDITLIKYVDLTNIQWLSKSAVLLQFPATAGQSVRFQASTNLTTWQDLATLTVPPDNIARYTDTTVSNSPHRFYRLAAP